MSVVFLTRSFPPHHTARSIQISRLAKHFSLPIRVICCDEEWRRDDTIAPGIETKVDRVVRVPLPGSDRLLNRLETRLQHRFKLPDAYRAWAFEAARVALDRQLIRSSDVLVTFGDPMSDHLAGSRLKRVTGVPWIAHFSDPWVDNPYRPDNAAGRLINGRMERRVIGAADIVVFTSQETLELVMGKYPDPWRLKACAIPHGFDPDLYPDTSGALDGEALVIRYIGSLYGQRMPGSFFRALSLLLARDPSLLRNVRIEFIGLGTEQVLSTDELGDLPKGLVHVGAPVSYGESLDLMRRSHILLLIDAPALESVFLPSKLIDYVGARRPILGVTPPGAAARLIRRLGGEVASPDDIGGIATGLTRALESVRRDGWSDGWRDETVRAEYKADAVSRKLEDIVRRLATIAGGRRSCNRNRPQASH